MLGFLLRKLGILIPTFFGVSFLAFMFIRVLPGDPILLMAGELSCHALWLKCVSVDTEYTSTPSD